MGTTADLARFIAETQYDDLPAAVVAAAKIGILDGIANLLAGSTQPVAQLVSAYALGWDVQQRIVAASHRAGANLRGFHVRSFRRAQQPVAAAH